MPYWGPGWRRGGFWPYRGYGYRGYGGYGYGGYGYGGSPYVFVGNPNPSVVVVGSQAGQPVQAASGQQTVQNVATQPVVLPYSYVGGYPGGSFIL